VSLGNDARDIGQLLSYALRPKMRPGLEGEYGRLLRRYKDEMSIRDAFNYVLDGMQLRVLHAGDLGVVLTAHRESEFAYRLAGEQGSGNKARNALRGLAHIGIAAYAYPRPDDLTDTTVRYVDVMAVKEFIRRACSQLKTRADEVAQGGETADRVVDLALAAGLDTVWSAWDQMPAIEIGTHGRSSGRISTKSTTYWGAARLQRPRRLSPRNGVRGEVGCDRHAPRDVVVVHPGEFLLGDEEFEHDRQQDVGQCSATGPEVLFRPVRAPWATVRSTRSRRSRS
jgi:hypothetical protein